MMTGLVFVSRLTGFVRTWAQAFTLGASMLASCYTVANNLPNLLFEITCGGLLYIAFLPVYHSVKEKAGKQGAASYASNMCGIILLLMSVLTVLAFIFATPLIFTQSAGAEESFSFDTATLFFRFFCVEVLLYPLSSLFGAILNAERKFFWGQAAPIFNNIVVIASFLIGFQVAQTNAWAGFLIYAIGNPLGVAVQAFLQVPPLKKAGIDIKPKVDFSDPALKEILKIGLPSLINALCAAIMASVQSSWSLVRNDAGAAILYYVRVWFVLPCSLFAVPIATATFTELSELFSRKKMEEFKERTMKASGQILYTMIPFMFYLMAFSPFLMAFFASGNFDALTYEESWVALVYIATALPFYALVSHLANVCAALHNLKFFAGSYAVSSLASCLFCVWAGQEFGVIGVVLSITVFNVCETVAVFARLRYVLGPMGIGRMILKSITMAILGIIGAIAGGIVAIIVAQIINGGTEIYSTLDSLVAIIVGGTLSLIVTYGPSILLKIPEADLIKKLLSRLHSKKSPVGKHGSHR